MPADYFTATPPVMEEGAGELVALSIRTGTETIRVMMSINTFIRMHQGMRRDLNALIESKREADVFLFEEDGGNVIRKDKQLRRTGVGLA